MPISERVGDLKTAITEHQVVIVAGETGSGKSTQLPKICLALGREKIGHTQPRRLAARSVAERVAEELDVSLGTTVGYAVRFTDRVGPDTRIKVMTDGILLAEIQRDRTLSSYDTLIIDEAHERSLNIDFLLGYLKQLLPRRPDLRLVITSATIDTDRFASHFDDAPVIEVTGRTFPVEVRYRPMDGPEVEESVDQPTAICDAVTELVRQGPGDILVFCSGERDIREAAEALGELQLRDTEIFPLFARMSSGDQHRVFSSHQGRRIVLATNVAETSLTVPGIRYVVDPGTARISRYSQRTKVQRLPIEPVSQASANQRAGRCGRVAPGICLRLYSEDDFLNRPEFTEPEILRTNLASVILQMATLGLGDIEQFPFVERPEPRSIRDGIALLEELGAVDPDHFGRRRWVTPLGRRLARLPVDPRLGRMVIEAGETACLREVLIIAAGLSVMDPRERPSDKRQAADEFHVRFADDNSDFLSLLHLWDYVASAQRERSSGQFRRLCRREFLNFNRLREWQDVHRQLQRMTRSMKLKPNDAAAPPDAIHRALMSGLLSQIGQRQPKKKNMRQQEYLGARGARFAVAPGSALFRDGPPWVMAAEMVETNRLWARTVAPINTQWAEELADHLVTRSYDEPWWDPDQGSAVTIERISLFGLPLVTGRQTSYGRIDPPLARDLFIEHALIEGHWESNHRFVEQNAEVRGEVSELEARTRSADLVQDRRRLFAFYDARVGSEVVDRSSFNRWWKKTRHHESDRLDLTLADVVGEVSVESDGFPTTWSTPGGDLRVLYEFDATSPSDGVTIEIPLAMLKAVDPTLFEWNVPGLRAELIDALIRTLPRDVRKSFVPVPETVRGVLDGLEPSGEPLRTQLADVLGRRAGVVIDPAQFDPEAVAGYLRPTFLLLDQAGDPFIESKDLEALRQAMDEQARAVVSNGRHDVERSGLRSWDLTELPARVEVRAEGHLIDAFPALADRIEAVDVVLTASPEEQADTHWQGLRRLLRFAMPAPVKSLDRLLANDAKLAMAVTSRQGRADWYNDCIMCAVDQLMLTNGAPVWDLEGFDRLVATARPDFPEVLSAVASSGGAIATTLARVEADLMARRDRLPERSATDIERHLSRLVYEGFLTGVGFDRLADLDRYLRAIEYRLQRLPADAARDGEQLAACLAVEAAYSQLEGNVAWSPELEEATWLLEELRVSLFAQPVGAVGPVSVKRVKNHLSRLA